MKRGLKILLGITMLMLFSQVSSAYDFIIKGYITSQQTGLPVENQVIKVESADPQYSVYKEAHTNAFGYYQIVLTFSAGFQLLLNVSTSDLCDQGNLYVKTVLSAEGAIMLNFEICEYLPPSTCEAEFTFNMFPNFTNNVVQTEFTDISSSAGTILSWFWNFDNGSSSVVQNPGTQFPGYPPDTYMVCLTISTDSQCVNTTCKPITVSDSLFAISSCNALFTFESDTSYNGLPDFTTVNFVNNSSSSGNILTYIWDFGDGNISTLADPQHAFYNLTADTFIVSLIIYTDDSCSSTYTDSIIISDPLFLQDCQAFYSYHNNPFDPTVLTFVDLSTTSDSIVDYLWSFGDGTYSVLENPVHPFASNGSYEVCLTVITSDSCISTYCEMVTADSLAQINCQAAFNYAGSGINTPGVFYDISYTSSNITDWIWDFGDGTVSQLQNPVHSYGQSGFYEVCLTIVTDQWCSSTYCDSIYYEYTNSNCYSGFSFSYNDPPFYNSVSFHNLSAPNVNSWSWDFGDGGSSTLANPLHIYTDGGLYNVCLTIETYDNCISSNCHYLLTGDSLSSVSCVADFVYGESGGVFQQGFFYDNSFSNSNIISWNWDFGDGTTSSGQNPVHFYQQSGYYSVCLSIESTNGCTSEYCDSVFYDTELAACFAWFGYDNFMDDSCVQFYNQSIISDGVLTSASWYFGDGTNSHDLNPSHCFVDYGTYDVCLKIISSEGCSDLICKTIHLVPDDGLYTVAGKVTASNIAVQEGEVLLMGKEGSLDKTSIVNGRYEFNNVLPDTYITYARPGSDLSQFYAPAYDPAILQWSLASEFYLDEDKDNIDIELLPFEYDSIGLGNISGEILWTDSTSTNTYRDRTSPSVADIAMFLFNPENKILSYQRTGASGEFDFDKLAYGTYKLFVELAGHITFPAIITVDETNEWVSDIVITVSNGIVFINMDEPKDWMNKLLIYPNPVEDQLMVQLPVNNNSYTIRLFDQTGRIIVEYQNVNEHSNVISMASLPAGSYFISVVSNNRSRVIKHLIHY